MKVTLYKYRDWDKDCEKTILTKNQLFLAPPSSFNDPFDCRIFAQFLDLSNEELEEYGKNLTSQGNLTEQQREYAINLIKDDPRRHQQNFEKTSIINYDKYLGIISMSTKWNNILMWSHYGNKHKGFCIGFDEEKLKKEIQFGAAGPVNYPESKEYPKISPLTDGHIESFLQTVYNKSLDWKYENEYRLTNIKRGTGLSNTDRVIEFSDTSISEVIIGLNASKEMENEILTICKSKKIRLFKTRKKQFHFELEREEIKY